MRTGCRGCLRRWCWSWSATLSSQSSTLWLRATPRGCSSRSTRRTKPSDDETKRYKHPSDCVPAAESHSTQPSHSQHNKSNPHSFSKRLNPPKKALFIGVRVCGCVCAFEDVCAVYHLSLFRFCSSSSHLTLGVCSAIGSTADLNVLL